MVHRLLARGTLALSCAACVETPSPAGTAASAASDPSRAKDDLAAAAAGPDQAEVPAPAVVAVDTADPWNEAGGEAPAADDAEMLDVAGPDGAPDAAGDLEPIDATALPQDGTPGQPDALPLVADAGQAVGPVDAAAAPLQPGLQVTVHGSQAGLVHLHVLGVTAAALANPGVPALNGVVVLHSAPSVTLPWTATVAVPAGGWGIVAALGAASFAQTSVTAMGFACAGNAPQLVQSDGTSSVPPAVAVTLTAMADPKGGGVDCGGAAAGGPKTQTVLQAGPEVSPPSTQAGGAHLLSDALPKLAYQNAKGEIIDVHKALAGKPGVVVVAAHACPMALVALSGLAALVEPWVAQGKLAVVAIDPWDKPATVPQMAVPKVSFPVLFSPLTTADSHAYSALLQDTLAQPANNAAPMPLVYVVDAKGVIVDARLGWEPAALLDALASLGVTP